MEEKKVWVPSRIRAIFGSKFSLGSFLLSSNKQFRFGANKLNSAGFTLVELLIVISVIGVLAAGFITLINPSHHLKNSRDSRRKSDLKQIQAALELYRSDQGLYPAEGGGHTVDNCSGKFVDTCGSASIVYLQSVSKDPSTGNNYYYCTGGCGSPANGYRIYSCLENANDTDPNKLSSLPGGVSISCPSGSAYYYTENP